MTGTADSNERYLGRYDVELLIVHPTLSPSEISGALGLDAQFAHRAGDQWQTPKGDVLTAFYPDTRWRHSRRFEASGQWFADSVAELLDDLGPHEDFFKSLSTSGGKAQLIIQFLGDAYFGDTLPLASIEKLQQLGLDLGIECFVEQQRVGRISEA